jgi:hypothetical protein
LLKKAGFGENYAVKYQNVGVGSRPVQRGAIAFFNSLLKTIRGIMNAPKGSTTRRRKRK